MTTETVEQENQVDVAGAQAEKRSGRMYFKSFNGKLAYVSQHPWTEKNQTDIKPEETTEPKGRITFCINRQTKEYSLPTRVLEAMAGTTDNQKRTFLMGDDLVLALGDTTRLPFNYRCMLGDYCDLIKRIAKDNSAVAMIAYR